MKFPASCDSSEVQVGEFRTGSRAAGRRGLTVSLNSGCLQGSVAEMSRRIWGCSSWNTGRRANPISLRGGRVWLWAENLVRKGEVGRWGNEFQNSAPPNTAGRSSSGGPASALLQMGFLWFILRFSFHLEQLPQRAAGKWPQVLGDGTALGTATGCLCHPRTGNSHSSDFILPLPNVILTDPEQLRVAAKMGVFPSPSQPWPHSSISPPLSYTVSEVWNM